MGPKLACVPDEVYRAMESVLEKARELFAPGEADDDAWEGRIEALQQAVEQADIEIEKVSGQEVVR